MIEKWERTNEQAVCCLYADNAYTLIYIHTCHKLSDVMIVRIFYDRTTFLYLHLLSYAYNLAEIFVYNNYETSHL